MREDVKKWIIKADHDLKVAKDELETNEPATDIICFHAQQCVEKYLKAYLVFKNKPFRKTHNIGEILKLCMYIDPEFEKLKELEIHELTVYATDLRYPEFFYIPSINEARAVVELAEKVREFVLKKLE